MAHSHKHPNSPTKLTEFAPLASEQQQSEGFFSRLFRRNNNQGSPVKRVDKYVYDDDDTSDVSDSIPRNQSERSLSADSSRSATDVSSRGSPVNTPSIVSQPRTHIGVLKRLSNILDSRSQTPKAYTDSDFKQYWMPDDNCKECYECGDKFNTFRRRHHCRICGQIFCSRCCNQEVPGKIMGYTGYLRVCTYCCKVVLTYAQNQDTSGDITALSEDLKQQLRGSDSDLESLANNSREGAWWTPTSKRKSSQSRISTIFDEEPNKALSLNFDPRESPVKLNPFDVTPKSDYNMGQSLGRAHKAMLQDSAQLRELWSQIQHPTDGVETQSHRLRLRTYANCIAGNTLVDWLLSKDKVTVREQAVAIGQALVDAQYLEGVTVNDSLFRDEYCLYKHGEAAVRGSPTEASSNDITGIVEDPSEPEWFREIAREDDEDDCELSKIPSTLSAPGSAVDDLQSGSVFYVDSRTDLADTHKSRKVQHLPTNSAPLIQEKGSKDEGVLPKSHTDVSLPGIKDIHGGVHPPPFRHQDSVCRGITDQLFKVISSHPEGNKVDGGETPGGWMGQESHLREENGERQAFENLNKAQKEHLTALTRQFLSKAGLSQKWGDIILHMVMRVTRIVRPDVRQDGDDMDIRQYVHIKKVSGGNKQNTSIVSGVVCSKNVAHRKMKQQINNPKILLLKAPIVYQRVESKFSSLEPQILQEREYLKNCVGRINALQPDILMVEKTVSRLAQEFILDTGITLVANVKPTVIERVSRFTQADTLTAVDGLVSKTGLGFCHSFKTQAFNIADGSTKTLMYFDGCASHLGCTIILRGGTQPELKKVKKILQFMVYATYHLKLEISFLMDEFASPPTHQIRSLSITDDENKPENSKQKTNQSVSSASSFGQSQSSVSATGSETDLVGMNKEVRQSLTSEPDLSAFLKPTEEKDKDSKLKMELYVGAPKNKIQVDEVDSSKRISSESIEKQVERGNSEPPTVSESNERFSQNQKDENLSQKLENVSQNDEITFQTDASSIEENSSQSNVVMRREKKRSPDFPRGIQSSSQVSSNQNQSMAASSIKEYSEKVAETNQKSSNNQQASPNVNPSVNTDIDSSNSADVPDGNGTSVPKLKTNSQNTSKEKLFSTQDKSKEFIKRGSTAVKDFSDPLHNYQVSKDESIFQSDVKLTEVIKSNQLLFKKALDDLVLSVSPYQRYEVPYLLTETGAQCRLRTFLPNKLFYSESFEKKMDDRSKEENEIEKKVEIPMSPAHPFVTEKIIAPICDSRTQASLADFRARGGRITTVYAGSISQKPAHKQDDQPKKKELRANQKLDCLDPRLHQKIAVLFSSFAYESVNAPHPCVSPWTVTMDFYGRNDITLGGFLERYCFREAYRCPSEECGTPMMEHIRRFVHDTGCIQVVLKHLDSPIPGYQNSVLMWAWCKICKQFSPIVPMSMDTWSMSFAKYLDIRYYSNQYTRRASQEPCHHSLHHDHIQYFGMKQTVAIFKYSPIYLREIALPPIVVTMKPPYLVKATSIDEAKMLHYKCTSVFDAILHHLHKIQRDSQNEQQMILISEYIKTLQDEKEVLKTKVDRLQHLLTHADGAIPTDDVFIIMDQETDIKRFVADIVVDWNYRLLDYDQIQKREKALSRSKPSKADTVPVELLQASDPSLVPRRSPTHRSGTSLQPSSIQSSTSSSIQGASSQCSTSALSDMESRFLASSCSQGKESAATIGSVDTDHFGGESWSTDEGNNAANIRPVSTGNEQTPHMLRAPSSPQILVSEDDSGHQEAQPRPLLHHRSLADIKRGSRLSIDQDIDKQEKKAGVKNIFSALLSSGGASQIEMPFPADEHHLLPNCKVPTVVYDKEPSSIIAYTLSSVEYANKLESLQQVLQREARGTRQGDAVSVSSLESTETHDSGITFGAFGKKNNRVLSFFKGGEPREQSPNRAKFDIGVVKYTPRLDRDSVEDTDEPDFAFMASNASESSKSSRKHTEPEVNYHIELSEFSDSSAKFYCRVYYAEHFRQLRKVVYPEGEERFIRSLSRCFTWLAKGGKSGSTFCKTQDDRFILKQMSRYEIQSFVEFAPHYFKYVTQCHSDGKPLVLAKILGVYRIGYRNSQTNATLKQDLLVMENLFYDRKITKVFDLKGSMRNRFVSTTGKRVEELVLLDENLLKYSADSPLYIRPHTKKVLTMAITHDTQFLSNHLVMDYSLLVGIDEHKNELVVGIIDYIRTFTWDKKLETMFKSTYSQLGGQGGKMPTVVSPDIYRTRFLEAMEKYFLPVPDRWTGLSKAIDS